MSAEIFSLEGRIALVTGASSGLGRHFAATLACAGARVALCARNMDRLQQAVKEIRAAGGEGVALSMDVRETGSVEKAFETARSRLGEVTIVVNNSGVAGAQRALDVNEASWDQILDTNLKGAWRVAQTAGRGMVAADAGGSIINIASILAFRVAGGVSPYAASKAGLVQLTRAMALELARHRIRVNAIAPGYFATEMNREFFHSPQGEAMVKRIPQRRVGDPGDLDGALLLLASDASAYMTGSTIVVDGGHLCSTL